MKNNFKSLEEAVTALEKIGRLEFFGRAGHSYEYCVYNFHHNDGRIFYLNIYDDGKIEFRDKASK